MDVSGAIVTATVRLVVDVIARRIESAFAVKVDTVLDVSESLRSHIPDESSCRTATSGM
jgi:hypothetical protein